MVGINLYAIHRSKDVWEDPDEFRPERFLNESHEVINADKIIPFGYGKCVTLELDTFHLVKIPIKTQYYFLL